MAKKRTIREAHVKKAVSIIYEKLKVGKVCIVARSCFCIHTCAKTASSFASGGVARNRASDESLITLRLKRPFSIH